jgi:hypothetical protein
MKDCLPPNYEKLQKLPFIMSTKWNKEIFSYTQNICNSLALSGMKPAGTQG